MAGGTAGGFARQGATATQLRAVYSAMRTLIEDDRDRATLPPSIVCDACQRDRPAAGSVDYSGTRLCNGCATDYEVLRMAGLVDTPAEYLGKYARAGRSRPLRSLTTA